MSTFMSTGSEAVFPLYCQPCSGEGKHLEAVGYCVDCEEHLCSTCFKYHLIPKPSRYHQLQDETEMPRQMKDKSSEKRCTDVCASHPNKVIEYFCREHNQLGCSVCTTLHHRTCKIDYIPDVADKVGDSEELRNLRWKLEILCNTLEKIKDMSNENKITAEAYRKNAKDEIKKLTCAFLTLMTKLEEDINKKIDSIADQDIQSMDDIALKCDAVAAEALDLTGELQKKEGNGQHCQLFVAMKNSEEVIRKLEETTKTLYSRNSIQRYHFTPDTKWQEIIDASPDIGAITVKRSSDIKVSHVKDIDMNFPDDAADNEAIIFGGVMLNDNFLAICNSHSEAVELIDIGQNKIVSTVTTTTPPACITVVNKDQVIVTLPGESKLHFLSVSGDTLHDTDHDICVDGSCWDVVSTQHHLIVSFFKSFEIEILDMNGTVLQSFLSSLDGDPENNSFAFLSLSPYHDLIYVSKFGTNSVVSLTLDGKVLNNYTDSNDNITTAGVLADKYGNVFVCGCEFNNVHVLTPDLKKIKVLLDESEENEPLWICTNKSANKLFIYMALKKKVKVYQLAN